MWCQPASPVQSPPSLSTIALYHRRDSAQLPFRTVKLERRNALHCRAEDGRNSTVTDIRKIDTEKGSLTHTLRETVVTPETLVLIALGVGGAFLAGYGQDGAVIGERQPIWNASPLGEAACCMQVT